MYKQTLIIVAILLTITGVAFSQNDLRIRRTTVMTIPGMTAISEADLAKLPVAARERMRNMGKSEKTVYIKNSWTRTDFDYEKQSGMKMKKVRRTMIDKCDKRQMIEFDDEKKEYKVNNYAQPIKAAKAGAAKSGGQGRVQITIVGTDTGERMKLFGYNARRMLQKVTMTPSANSCMKSPMTIDIDGWYADVPTYACAIKSAESFKPEQGGCSDEIDTQIKGVAVTGIPIKEVRVMQLDGRTTTMTEQVVELVNTTLDASLFGPPAGYTASKGSSPMSDSSAEALQPPVAPPTPADLPAIAEVNAAAALPVKKAGVVRIGIAAPAMDMGSDFNADPNTVIALRNTLAVALKNDNTEIVMLDSTLTEVEAKQKNCDYIFYSKVTRKKGGGMFGGMMGPMLAGAAAGMIPGVGGMIGSVASSTIMTAASISGGFKSKDEVGFEYRVSAIDGTVSVPTTTGKLKAKKNGDDVLTPQIVKAAETTLAKIGKP